MDSMNRREMLQIAAGFAATSALGYGDQGLSAAQPASGAGETLRFFPGFKSARVKTSGRRDSPRTRSGRSAA